MARQWYKDPSRDTDLIQSDFQLDSNSYESSVSSVAWCVSARACARTAMARRDVERNCFVHRADMVRNGVPSDRLRRRSRTSIIGNHDGYNIHAHNHAGPGYVRGHGLTAARIFAARNYIIPL